MPRSKKTSNDTLTYTKKTVYELNGKKAFDTALAYAEEYKKFLDTSKTEREAVATAIKMAEANGYKAYSLGKTVKPGDRYYFNNRDKNLFLFQIGSEPLENGIRITASHIDSPRLDLKPCPLYEESGMSFFKTHYYGGIRKYQWVTVPLALHGIVARTDGTVVNINIGDEDGDPVFYVDDLLPHLGRATNAKPLGEAIPAEKLNVVTGSFPGEKADEKDAVKAYTLSLIHEKYGICEEDFFSADLCLVPAGKARDVGFDRSLIVGYGHDDKCCAYPSLTALFAAKDSPHTLLTILADKEEIGSEGVSGMQCDLVLDLIDQFSKSLKANPAIVRANSKCLSADVTANYDPAFSEVFEIRNSAIVNCGISLMKYTGSGGKGGSNDAPAEYVAWIRQMLKAADVVWQMAELGKVDVGGGGTVAKYLANHNIPTIDIGVGVLSMHAPYELISKADLYEGHKAMLSFNTF